MVLALSSDYQLIEASKIQKEATAKQQGAAGAKDCY